MAFWWFFAAFIVLFALRIILRWMDAREQRHAVVAAERERRDAQRESFANSFPNPTQPRPATGPRFPQACDACRVPGHTQCSGDAECPCCQTTVDKMSEADEQLRAKVANALTQLGYSKAQANDAVTKTWDATEHAEQAVLKAALRELGPRR